MTDDLREKIARVLRSDRYDATVTTDALADAVLAVLPTYEQVGWFHKNLGTLMPLHKPQGWANDREPVFRRGAAVPEEDAAEIAELRARLAQVEQALREFVAFHDTLASEWSHDDGVLYLRALAAARAVLDKGEPTEERRYCATHARFLEPDEVYEKVMLGEPMLFHKDCGDAACRWVAAVPAPPAACPSCESTDPKMCARITRTPPEQPHPYGEFIGCCPDPWHVAPPEGGP